MQEVVEPLTVIVEFSIGLAGFAGIIAAFDRQRIRMDPVLRFRFIILIITAFSPGFLALTGICALYFDLPVDDALRAASGLALLVLVAMLGYGAFGKPPGLPMLMLVFMFIVSALNICLHGYNVLVVPEHITGVFLLALVLMLLQAAVVFAVTALARYQETH